MADKSNQQLIVTFAGWKVLLLAIAVASPGPGYDTSTALLLQLPQSDLDAPHTGLSYPATLVQSLVRRLIRWDAIYFSSIAAYGHQYEQQWAFGWGYAHLVGALTAVSSPEAQALTGVVLNICCHLASVLLLHQLCLVLLGPSRGAKRLAFVAALLHVLAPAGSLLYVHGMRYRTVASDACLVLAGLVYGLSSTVRSNGILAGSTFAIDLALALPNALKGDARFVRTCAALIAGGLLVGVGFAAPQLIAYNEFCRRGELGGESPRRSWCDALPPSIYNFVQNHYWNLGFGKYWTLSNIPLFLLATPMLAIMLTSSVSALTAAGRRAERKDEWTAGMWRFAVPQLLLTVLTFTNFHVQIITRIATGYFVHYVWVASVLEHGDKIMVLGRQFDLSKIMVRWMVVYGVVQGGLYASHLPPA